MTVRFSCPTPGVARARAMSDATSVQPADATPGAPDAATGLSDLVAWITMEEPAQAGVLVDASGQGHPAVCVGACPALVPGTVGQAAEFAAMADYLEIVDDGALASPAGLTVMSWFSLRSLTDRSRAPHTT